MRVNVFDSVILTFAAVPFPIERVKLEKRHPLMVVDVCAEKDDGEIVTRDAFKGTEEEDVEEAVMNSRERVPDEWKNNGQSREEILNAMDVNVTAMDGVDITNIPDLEVSEIDSTLLEGQSSLAD